MKSLVRCGGRGSHGVCEGWMAVEKPTDRAGFDGKEAYETDEHECFACFLNRRKDSLDCVMMMRGGISRDEMKRDPSTQ